MLWLWGRTSVLALVPLSHSRPAQVLGQTEAFDGLQWVHALAAHDKATAAATGPQASPASVASRLGGLFLPGLRQAPETSTQLLEHGRAQLGAMAFVPVRVDPAAPNAGLRLQHALAHADEAGLLQCGMEVARTLCSLRPE